MTNRELLKRLEAEFASDCELDEEATTRYLLDMAGCAELPGASDAYLAWLQSDIMESEFGDDWFRVVRVRLGKLPAAVLDLAPDLEPS